MVGEATQSSRTTHGKLIVKTRQLYKAAALLVSSHSHSIALEPQSYLIADMPCVPSVS